MTIMDMVEVRGRANNMALDLAIESMKIAIKQRQLYQERDRRIRLLKAAAVEDTGP